MNVYVPGRRLDSLYVRPGFLLSRYPKVPPATRAELNVSRRSGVSRSSLAIACRFPPIVESSRKLAPRLDSFDRTANDDGEESILVFPSIPYGVVGNSIDESDLFWRR